MSHSVIIIDEAIDSLRGNATSGKLTDLRASVHTVDANLPTLSGGKKIRAEQALEDVQDWLTTSGSYSGACGQTDALIDGLSEFV